MANYSKRSLDILARVAPDLSRVFLEAIKDTPVDFVVVEGLRPDGSYGEVPIKAHGHAKDAERYVFLNLLSNIPSGFDVTVGSASRK